MLNRAIDLLYFAKEDGIEILLNEDQLQLKVPKNKHVDKRLIQGIRENKDSIIDFLKNRTKVSQDYKKRFNRQTVSKVPLSFSQERLWFIDKLQGSVQYHIPAVLRLTGDLNKEALSYALKSIVARHEVLRTVFLEEEGKAYQSIRSEEDWALKLIDGLRYRSDPMALRQYTEELIKTPFDLSKDYMLTASLITLEKDEHILVIVMHHIASDGWSLSIFVREFAEFYESYDQGREARLNPLEIQYADYSISQRNYLQGEVLDRKLDYWKSKLQGLLPLNLSTDYNRPAVQSTNGANFSCSIDSQLLSGLQELSRKQDVTLFMTLLAAFKVLLSRYTGQSDICVGSPIANRNHHEEEALIGFFVNTLALRTDVRDELSFIDLLQQVRQTTLGAYEYQDVPFEKVVEAVVKERDISRSPLFQVMFVLQNTPEKGILRLGKVKLSGEPLKNDSSKFDITFNATQVRDTLHITVEFCTDLYRQETIVRMTQHYKQLLSSAVSAPYKKVSELRMLTELEEHQLQFEFNDTELEYPKDGTIVGLFEEQVLKTPDGVAVVFDEQRVTYRELNERANKLAHYLVSKGVKEEVLVPICLERSIELMVGILGILKAGGAYVPIDAEYPMERIRYMLEDIKASIIVTRKDTSSKLSPAEGVEIIEIDDLPLFSGKFAENVGEYIRPDQLAYIIYTSGSTGTPKGVMIEQGNVVSLVKGVNYVKLSPEDILLSTGSPSFDATTFEYWGMLLNGGLLVLCTQDDLLDPHKLKSLIRSRKVNKIWFTSSWFNQLVDIDITIFEGLRTILVGGEKLSESHIEKIRRTYPDIEIVNGYGPTENTTFSLTYSISETKIEKSIPIGRPLNNRNAFILSKQRQVVPIGIAGEIYVGGAGLSRGYLNQETLTAEKFLKQECGQFVERLYKTGDLGRWLEDGNIEYLGRLDQQVKIRGHRIEMGEIESVVLKSGLVQEAVIILKEDNQGNKRLVGYVVSTDEFDKNAIINYLQEKLPEYMVPLLWVPVDYMPLTANGKIDKKGLPEISLSDAAGTEHIAPRTLIETQLAEIWSKLLGIEQIGIGDSFFELGGDSIITIQVVSQIRRLGYEVQPKDLFVYQTIESLAKAIENRSGSSIVGELGVLSGVSGLLPIQKWFLEKPSADKSHFNQSVLLKLNKQLGFEFLQTIIQQLISHHDALRFKYTFVGSEWVQTYESGRGELLVENIETASDNNLSSVISDLANQYQKSLSIEKGELFRFVLLKTPSSQASNRLLIIIHHLAVDGVSWRILLEDLEFLIDSSIDNGKNHLKNKTSSYRQWFNALKTYGQSKEISIQRDYWNKVVSQYSPLKVDKNFKGVTRIKDMNRYPIRLGTKQTQQLLQDVPKVYQTEINDILLSALVLTFWQWNSSNSITIGLEGHGRENISDEVDTSRTVGWMTALFPLLLKVEGSKDIGDIINDTKNQLREIPDKGLGYGVLKYINQEESMQSSGSWDVVFNYLGQFDNVVSKAKWFSAAEESVGVTIDPELPVDEKISINGLISGGSLILNWNYSSNHFEAETIIRVADSYLLNLEKIIAECLEKLSAGKILQIPTKIDPGFGLSIKRSLKYEDYKFLVPIKIGSKKSPLYIVSGGGGTAFKFKKMVDLLAAEQTVFGLQQPTNPSDLENFPETIEEISEKYIEEILRDNPEGPFALSGHCTGGLIAYEIAKQLKLMGKNVCFLAMFDTIAPNRKVPNPPSLGNFFNMRLILRRSIIRAYLKIDFETYLIRNHTRHALDYKWNSVKSLFKKMMRTKREENVFEIYRRLERSLETAHHKYKVSPYEGNLFLYYPKDHYHFLDVKRNVSYRRFHLNDSIKNRWKEYSRSIEIYEVEGEHSTMFDPEHGGKELAKLLQKHLNIANKNCE